MPPLGRQTKGKINGIPPEFREAAADKCFRDLEALAGSQRSVGERRAERSQLPILSRREMNASESLSYCDRRCNRVRESHFHNTMVGGLLIIFFVISSSREETFRRFIPRIFHRER